MVVKKHQDHTYFKDLVELLGNPLLHLDRHKHLQEEVYLEQLLILQAFQVEVEIYLVLLHQVQELALVHQNLLVRVIHFSVGQAEEEESVDQVQQVQVALEDPRLLLLHQHLDYHQNQLVDLELRQQHRHWEEEWLEAQDLDKHLKQQIKDLVVSDSLNREKVQEHQQVQNLLHNQHLGGLQVPHQLVQFSQHHYKEEALCKDQQELLQQPLLNLALDHQVSVLVIQLLPSEV